MSLHDDLATSPDIATAFAEALTQQLGDGTPVSAGEAATSIREVMPQNAERAVSVAFASAHPADGDDDAADGDAVEGTVIFVLTTTLVDRLEPSAPDELVITAVTPALIAAVVAIGTVAGASLEPDAASQIDAQPAVDDTRPVVVYPMLEDGTTVGCLVIYVGDGAEPAASAPVAATASIASATSMSSPFVLADVEMGVTAELGRCHMTIREVLSLTPGAVIDLDRAAGAPVDVLVNGTVIARGEVVVIDEEFGIRISEILGAA